MGTHVTLAICSRTVTTAAVRSHNFNMFDTESILFWGLGGVLLVGAFLLLRSHFSAEAREARRRARSHGRVVSKGRRPLVRLAAKIGKPKRDG
jgi:hypothetical protein